MDKLWLLRYHFHKPEERSNENNMENKFARFLRNTGPARFFLPMGVLALVFGVLKTVKAFQKSKALDQMPKAPTADFEGFKQAPGVRELYCRHDGVTLKPGYILEDGNCRVLFEGKMTKQAVIGARSFEFVNHATGAVTEHEVGHTVTQSWNDELFSASSWFKFDGRNVWDLLHERGIRLSTDLRSRFPNLVYNVSKDGAAFARIESSGKYVHEDEAAEHRINVVRARLKSPQRAR